VGGPDCHDGAGYRVCSTRALASAEDGGEQNHSDLELHDSDLQLYFLEVDVTWRDGAGDKTYTLKTLRAAAEPE
jgi:hypothetical protein